MPYKRADGSITGRVTPRDERKRTGAVLMVVAAAAAMFIIKYASIWFILGILGPVFVVALAMMFGATRKQTKTFLKPVVGACIIVLALVGLQAVFVTQAVMASDDSLGAQPNVELVYQDGLFGDRLYKVIRSDGSWTYYSESGLYGPQAIVLSGQVGTEVDATPGSTKTVSDISVMVTMTSDTPVFIASNVWLQSIGVDVNSSGVRKFGNHNSIVELSLAAQYPAMSSEIVNIIVSPRAGSVTISGASSKTIAQWAANPQMTVTMSWTGEVPCSDGDVRIGVGHDWFRHSSCTLDPNEVVGDYHGVYTIHFTTAGDTAGRCVKDVNGDDGTTGWTPQSATVDVTHTPSIPVNIMTSFGRSGESAMAYFWHAKPEGQTWLIGAGETYTFTIASTWFLNAGTSVYGSVCLLGNGYEGTKTFSSLYSGGNADVYVAMSECATASMPPDDSSGPIVSTDYGWLVVIVLLPNGEPVVGAVVTVGNEASTTDSGGSAAFQVEAGTHDVAVEHATYGGKTITATVTKYERVSVEVVLDGTTSIEWTDTGNTAASTASTSTDSEGLCFTDWIIIGVFVGLTVVAVMAYRRQQSGGRRRVVPRRPHKTYVLR